MVDFGLDLPFCLRRFSVLLALACFFITASQPVSAFDCVKTSSVKANMHTLQTILETYYADHHRYPAYGTILEREARIHPQPYWKEFVNPFLSETGYGKSWGDLHQKPVDSKDQESIAFVLGIRMNVSSQNLPLSARGMVIYAPVSKQKYYLYGYGSNGELIKDKGQVFCLSNS
ncbi:MAG: hypothetical protein IV090_18950 [Candidatus Sericytochromatia bacterium]|nr:hypothetical protein [Candidatus Sericytochromatia bacterium]